MSTILLLLIALVAPWAVHLAPPRQRALALVAAIAVLLLYGIFVSNPLASWALYAGLALGLVSVVAVAGPAAHLLGLGARARGGGPRRPPPRTRER